MNNKVICIAGRKGSGKSTLARYLQNMIIQAGYGCFIQPIAGPLKSVAQWWGLDVTSKDHVPCPFGGLTVRQFLQQFGQAMRGIDRNFWLKLWVQRAMDRPGAILIVDDLRFQNEREWFSNVNASLIRLLRNGDLPKDTDISENDLNDTPNRDFDLAVSPNLGIAETQQLVWPHVASWLELTTERKTESNTSLT